MNIRSHPGVGESSERKSPDVAEGTQEATPVCPPGYIHIQANILQAGSLAPSFQAPWQDHSSMLCRKALRIKKSGMRETKHLSTDAESSTDTIVGWTKNSPKPDYFEKQKKSIKTQKLKNV